MKFKSQLISIIGIVILAYLLFTINLTHLLEILKTTNFFYLSLALSTNIVIILLLTWRWKHIVHAMGTDTTFKNYLIWRLKGAFLGSITPGKIGDLYRATNLTEETSFPLAKSFSSVIIDRIVDIFALILLSIIGIFIVIKEYKLSISIIESAIFFILITTGLIILLNKKLTKKLLGPLFKVLVPKKTQKKAFLHFNEFYDGAIKVKISNYAVIFSMSILIWLITTLGVYFLTLSINMNTSLIFMVAMVPLASFLSALPISIGGLGTREAIYIFFLSGIGISSEYAVALSLLTLLFLNLIFVPIGIVLYLIPGTKTRWKNNQFT